MDELARPHGESRRGRGKKTSENHSHHGGVDNPLPHPPAPRGSGDRGHLIGHRAGPSAHHQPAHPRPSLHHSRAHHAPHRGQHAQKHSGEPTLRSEHAALVAFDSGSYTATIALARSPDVTISGVPVSRAIAAATIAAGQLAAVLFFDHHDPGDAMIVGVY